MYKVLDDFDHGILSPSGRISKRARELHLKRTVDRLWPNGCTREDIHGSGPMQPTKKEKLLSQAVKLRDLASRGMSTKKFNREADRLEEEASKL